MNDHAQREKWRKVIGTYSITELQKAATLAAEELETNRPYVAALLDVLAERVKGK